MKSETQPSTLIVGGTGLISEALINRIKDKKNIILITRSNSDVFEKYQNN